MASRTGVSIHADTSQLRGLGRALRVADAEILMETKAELAVIGEQVAETARQNAQQFSTRIPASIHTRRTRGLNVRIEAGGPNAPHAAPIENKGEGFVYHPVFGSDMIDWTRLNSPPAYLAPALAAHREELDPAIEAALVHALQRALDMGFAASPKFAEARAIERQGPGRFGLEKYVSPYARTRRERFGELRKIRRR